MAVTDYDEQGGSGLSYDDDSAQWGKKGGQADLDFFLKLASPQ